MKRIVVIVLSIFCISSATGAEMEKMEYGKSFSVRSGNGVGLMLRKKTSAHNELLFGLDYRYNSRKSTDDANRFNTETSLYEDTTSNYINRYSIFNLSVGLRNHFRQGNFSPFVHTEIGVGYNYYYRNSYLGFEIDKTEDADSLHNLGLFGMLGFGFEYFFNSRISISGVYAVSAIYDGYHIGGNRKESNVRIGDVNYLQVSFHW